MKTVEKSLRAADKMTEQFKQLSKVLPNKIKVKSTLTLRVIKNSKEVFFEDPCPELIRFVMVQVKEGVIPPNDVYLYEGKKRIKLRQDGKLFSSVKFNYFSRLDRELTIRLL